MSRGLLFSCIIAFFVCATFAKEDPKQDELDVEGRSKILAGVQLPVRQLDGYQKWPMLTPGPVDVSDGEFFRCGIHLGDLDESLNRRKTQGLHWAPAVRVYANAPAKAAIDGNKTKFPAGSILVKEKLVQKEIVAITAMIRERDDYDYSDEKNNWRYFYIDQRAEMQFGRIESCRKCHQKAAETDFAFLKYPDRPGYSSGP